MVEPKKQKLESQNSDTSSQGQQAADKSKKQIEEFEFIKQVGEGSFGSVYLAKEIKTAKLVAIKTLEKSHIVKFDKTKAVFREKDILQQFAYHPNVINLDCVFQDKQNLYFVFEHCPNGTLSNLIKLNGKLSEVATQIYAAEIINVLEAIHYNNVMHRDLKPENILMTSDYHLKVIDFGDSKYIVQEPSADDDKDKEKSLQDEFHGSDPSFDRRGTFVGTAYYVSPEMLKLNQATAASDIWALGCIIYKLLTGREPFQGSTDYFTFQMILERKLAYKPEDKLSDDAMDLIDRLLQVEPYMRLGSGQQGSRNDYQALKNHPFFKGINFDSVNSMVVPLDKKLPDEEVLTSQTSFTEVQQDSQDENRVVHQGELKKRNPYFMNQVRLFKLYAGGKMEYYKDSSNLRGSLYLTHKSKVVKTAKDKFEIHNHDRTYFLSESDTEKCSSGTWIDKLEEVITSLK